MTRSQKTLAAVGAVVALGLMSALAFTAFRSAEPAGAAPPQPVRPEWNTPTPNHDVEQADIPDDDQVLDDEDMYEGPFETPPQASFGP